MTTIIKKKDTAGYALCCRRNDLDIDIAAFDNAFKNINYNGSF